MKKNVFAFVGLAAIAGALTLPTIANGNARRNEGTLSGLQLAETPFVADLKGSNEVPNPGDPDGAGAATISIDYLSATEAQVCWDMAYSNIATPTAAHIHPGATGQANPPIVDFGVPTENSDTGCTPTTAAIADQILANPAGYYVNVHTGAFPGGAIRGQLAEGPPPAGSQHFLPTPLRAYDSRIAPATKLAAGATQIVSLATGKDLANVSAIAVPPGATAAIVTITVTQTDGPGFLKVYSAASTEPATSSINYPTAGTTVAVSTTVAVDASGSVKVTAGPAGTHFLIDVIGYNY